jgi:hypothetical protein
VLEFIQVWKNAGNPPNASDALSREQLDVIDDWAAAMHLVTDGDRNKSRVWRLWKSQESSALWKAITFGAAGR